MIRIKELFPRYAISLILLSLPVFTGSCRSSSTNFSYSSLPFKPTAVFTLGIDGEEFMQFVCSPEKKIHLLVRHAPAVPVEPVGRLKSEPGSILVSVEGTTAKQFEIGEVTLFETEPLLLFLSAPIDVELLTRISDYVMTRHSDQISFAAQESIMYFPLEFDLEAFKEFKKNCASVR